MELQTAREFSRLTSAFYTQVESSFSATRAHPWEGWTRVFDLAKQTLGTLPSPLLVLDLACGNLRFERFLADELAGTVIPEQLVVHAFDSCDSLVQNAVAPEATVVYRHLDIAQALFAGEDLGLALGGLSCQLAACFGFMHHLALPEHRSAVLDALVRNTAPGGLLAVSFWQLSRSERLLRKARATTAGAARSLGLRGLADNDYLLGWQERDDVFRYCHDYSETEIDELVEGLDGARELARFSADGGLNRYVLLMREK